MLRSSDKLHEFHHHLSGKTIDKVFDAKNADEGVAILFTDGTILIVGYSGECGTTAIKVGQTLRTTKPM